jgi:hypothetical protein
MAMEQETATTIRENNSAKIWIGVAVGTAIGIGIAYTRRPKKKRTGWDIARQATKNLSDRSGDLADAARDIVERVKTIYDEGARIAEDAGELWARGRKLVQH